MPIWEGDLSDEGEVVLDGPVGMDHLTLWTVTIPNRIERIGLASPQRILRFGFIQFGFTEDEGDERGRLVYYFDPHWIDSERWWFNPHSNELGIEAFRWSITPGGLAHAIIW